MLPGMTAASGTGVWRGYCILDETKKPEFELDLRGVACPLNFVKTKLFLDKLSPGQTVRVLLDAGEPIESVSASMQAEGQEIIENQADAGGHYCLSIRKV
jgi:TusA-related sulfurtransferase